MVALSLYRTVAFYIIRATGFYLLCANIFSHLLHDIRYEEYSRIFDDSTIAINIPTPNPSSLAVPIPEHRNAMYICVLATWIQPTKAEAETVFLPIGTCPMEYALTKQVCGNCIIFHFHCS